MSEIAGALYGEVASLHVGEEALRSAGRHAIADRIIALADKVKDLESKYAASQQKLGRVRALTETRSFLVHRDMILAVLDD